MELLDLTATVVELVGLKQPGHMQGRLRLPVLTGNTSPNHNSVRCDYSDALQPHFIVGSGAFGTICRRGQRKLVIYHGHGHGHGHGRGHGRGERYNLAGQRHVVARVHR